MNNKKGFTLVEILVTVLIIGILVALALPQYKRTVEKVKLQEALINGKYITDEMQRWLLANQGNGYLELDIGTLHSYPDVLPPDDTDDCVWVFGQIPHYHTKDFIYSAMCNPYSCLC